jgi:NTE family protein
MQRLVRLLRGRGTLVSPDPLRRLLEAHLPARHSDLEIRTAVIATDLLSGDPVVLDEGDLRENLLASAAIPGVFPPVQRAGRVLGDGGIAAHVPVLEAAELGAATIVVLDTGYPCTLTQLPHGVVPNVVHLLNLMLRHQAVAALSLLGARCPVLYLPSPCPLGVAPHDFTRARTLIAAGYAAASRYLARMRVHGPGVYGHPHFHASSDCDDSAVSPPALTAPPATDRDLVTAI